MKKYRPRFEYWDDDHTKLIAKTKPKEFLDPEYYIEAHIREDPKWPHRYFLNKRCWNLMNKDGPFKDPYFDCEALVDLHEGKDAYIYCPGPSMKEIPKRKDSVVMAVNSAGFAVKFDYWVMAESGYARWVIEQRHPTNRSILATARVAVVLREEERKQRRQKYGPVYVLRWEEERIVPPRTPAVSITNALVTAWQMGCPRVFLIGLDLSKEGGPYVKGVPHTAEGAANPFDDQIRALRQFELPGLKVYNCSPVSKDILPFEFCNL